MKTLEIKNLCIKSKNEILLNNFNLKLQSKKITALVGKSGSGKTLSSTALMGFLPKNLQANSEIYLNNQKITHEKNLFSVIMQNPKSAFDPLFTMGQNAKETLEATNKKISKELILESFLQVGLKDPKRVYKLYPFEMSGGMLQRVMIALALLQDSPFMIADEPTTDLDLIVQSRILNILENIAKNKNIGILLITHDIGVVAKIANDVYIINKGEIIEHELTNEIFKNPKNEITKELINAHLSLYKEI